MSARVSTFRFKHGCGDLCEPRRANRFSGFEGALRDNQGGALGPFSSSRVDRRNEITKYQLGGLPRPEFRWAGSRKSVYVQSHQPVHTRRE
ncbi:hypothetical protein Plhal304r1_c042g0121461 [Plasmopara halstedii]